MKPNAGSGKLSRELALKIVAFDGFIERSMLFVRITALPVDAGRGMGTNATAGTAGSEGLAGFVGRLLLDGR